MASPERCPSRLALTRQTKNDREGRDDGRPPIAVCGNHRTDIYGVYSTSAMGSSLGLSGGGFGFKLWRAILILAHADTALCLAP